MDNTIFPEATLKTDADYETAADWYLSEIQKKLDQMQADQTEIDRLKAETQAIQAKTQAIVDKLKATT